MLLTTAATVIGLYVLVVVAAFLLQRQLMYFPDRTRIPPAAVGVAGVEEIEILRPDGAVLVAWFRAPDEGQPTLVYFHGNAGSVASRAHMVSHFADRGYGLLFLNYRSYGGSTGSPSEEALIGDGLAMIDELNARGIDTESIALYGESLGSAIAVQVAAQRDVRAVILQAPFTSAVDVATAAYPFLPVRWLLLDRYNSVTLVGTIEAPLLIVHGEEDRIVPFVLGQRLYEAASEPKLFHAVAGVGHNELDTRALTQSFIDNPTVR